MREAAFDSGRCACAASSASFRQRGAADFALGRGDRAQEGGIVVGIGEHAQPRQRVLHFLAFEEGGAAAQVIGHAQQLQRFFQRPRLVVAAEQDRELAPGHVLALLEVLDLGGDALGLVRVVAALPTRAPTRRRRAGSTAAWDARAGSSRSAGWRNAGCGRCSGSSARA
jgi:hypothetical protein